MVWLFCGPSSSPMGSMARERDRRPSAGPGRPQLTLRCHVGGTRGVPLFEAFRNCRPVCVVTTNLYFTGHTRALQGSNSQWDQLVSLKLPRNPVSDQVRVIVYDIVEVPAVTAAATVALDRLSPSPSPHQSSSSVSVSTTVSTAAAASFSSSPSGHHRHKYLYVGEVQLNVAQLFDEGKCFDGPWQPQWYTLYDRKRELEWRLARDQRREFPMGELQLSFTLVASMARQFTLQEAFALWLETLASRTTEKQLGKLVPLDGSTEVGDSTGDNDAASTAAAPFDLKSLVTALDEYDVVSEAQLDDDDDDEDDEDDDALTSEQLNDIQVLLQEVRDEDDDEDQSFSSANSSPELLTARSRTSSLGELGSDGYSRDSDVSSSEALSMADSANRYNDEDDELHSSDTSRSLQFKPDGGKLLNLRRRTRSNYLKRYNIDHKSLTSFKVSKRQHSLGVVFIELQSIRNLPILKNKISRRKYDMDPFIITTFGRRVFKSSFKKHTLNPIYNECLAFELFEKESHFSLHFKIMDKDSFSFNDEIALHDLPWEQISAVLSSQSDTLDWQQFEIPLTLTAKKVTPNTQQPVLNIKVKFTPYNLLKRNFWKHAVAVNSPKTHYDFVDLLLFLDKLGCFTDYDALEFFQRFDKHAWAGEFITQNELTRGLETWTKLAEFKNIWRCPSCLKAKKKSNNSRKSKLTRENDLITHFAICCFQQGDKVLKPSYVSSAMASKRWFSKVWIKLTYGKYALGSNNANILVQDRDTGIIIEEKISAHVKLGMRIIYNGKGKESRKFRNLLKTLSVRQGKKFDDPSSVKQIDSFIKFHSLDLSQCLDTKFNTFNEFFYRKLKPGSRPVENADPQVMVSPADSRCTVFSSIEKTKRLWIKSSKFSIEKLAQNYRMDQFKDKCTSIAIFRLAPQDYHRFHCPCDAVMGEPRFIEGEYYTVNPMAIRSELDVFGENVRVVIPMQSAEFGEFLLIAVGAMMVGSVILTRKFGDKVQKGEELGYFKFGGSTIILVLAQPSVLFDSDLVNNSIEQIETLVKVGMSIGHTPGSKECKRTHRSVANANELDRIKRTISVGACSIRELGGVTWQYDTLKSLIKDDLGTPGDVSTKR
ncbi:phosphatidylserine decarboxylase 2 KNAG_0E03670 [Huiozyma naganishii CBS 8797]|uniref:Phosphatidylserine decarboxylase proenzyme 2 n=1 Tax=Huiozyma naganishii (strain ATCC MYA-139 / BCRC 22969 / CBS 8797 / KCTC 17520 / NBRC 10181 / NCYC 3082 / Yp74L-3) TaxID=1071383 RepID=J7S6W4_HUIN7|nr:hypothetical protein KNAG_0E03670 [Kazachstania naganishii CBS 8797]CCK70624.1 hypothetical protein KNAG_0E03670 [Kazachstania naganishii CBS 8797]